MTELALVDPVAAAWRPDDDVPCCHGCGNPTDAPLVVGCFLSVLRVLEVLGKRIVRVPRSRYAVLAGRPFETAHTIWPAEHRDVVAALDGSFDHLGPLLDLFAPDVVESPVEVAQHMERLVWEVVAERRLPTLPDVRVKLRPLVGSC